MIAHSRGKRILVEVSRTVSVRFRDIPNSEESPKTGLQAAQCQSAVSETTEIENKTAEIFVGIIHSFFVCMCNASAQNAHFLHILEQHLSLTHTHVHSLQLSEEAVSLPVWR